MAAGFFARAEGGNWSDPNTWSTTSSAGPANTGGLAPGSGNNATLDAGSGPVTVDTTSCICSSLIMPNYANTLNCASGMVLNPHASVTLGGTITGKGTLIIGNSTTTSTITPNDKIWPGSVTLAGTGTKTLAAAFTVTGGLTVTGTCSLTGAYTLYCSSLALTSGSLTGGTAIIETNGVVTTNSAYCIANALRLISGASLKGPVNYGGTAGNTLYFVNAVTTTGSTLNIRGSCTLNLSNAALNRLTIIATSTMALSSALTINGILTTSAAATFSGAYAITCTGGINDGFGLTTANVLNISGGSVTSSGGLTALTINIYGTTTLGSIRIGNNTSVIAAGANITVTADTTLTLAGTITLNTGSYILWQNVSGTATVSLGADLRVVGAFTGTGALTFDGAFVVRSSGGFTGTGTILGSATLQLTGGTVASTWGGFGISTNFAGGTITIQDTFKIVTGGKTFNYVSGSVEGPDISTPPNLQLTTSQSLSVAAISWGVISNTGAVADCTVETELLNCIAVVSCATGFNLSFNGTPI